MMFLLLFILLHLVVVTPFTRNRPIRPTFHRQKHNQLQMFTGIIEEMGSITNLIKSSVPSWEDPTKVVPGYTFTISSPTGLPLQDAYLGASIAVSGICLTATSLDPQTKTFSVGVAAETLRLTTLGPIVDEMEAAGGIAESYPANVHPVNLERAAGERARILSYVTFAQLSLYRQRWQIQRASLDEDENTSHN